MEQRGVSCYLVEWTNFSINIKTLYDCCDKKQPIAIRVYDADSVGFDAVEYREEFDQSSKKLQEQLHCAAEWVKQAIKNKMIVEVRAG